jgi:polysaccharide biosynthesis/export protein
MKIFNSPTRGTAVLLGLAVLLAAAPTYAQNSTRGVSEYSPSLQSLAQPAHPTDQPRLKVDDAEANLKSGESRIGPDDLLDITVFEAPELNRTVRVEPDGEISLELIGDVRAAGLTPKELESVLQELLRRTYIKDPHVGVFVHELESHPVSVVGAVKQPGVFQIRGTKTVIEMLSMAQGLTDDAGDTVLIMRGAGFAETSNSRSQEADSLESLPLGLTHADPPGDGNTQSGQEKSNAIEKINLKKLLDSTDPALNVPVRSGDIVKVPRAGIVYVVGEVGKPGGFVLQSNENISVLQALALAGGPTHTSALRQARIIRTDSASGKRREIPMNLGKILSGKSPDMMLQPKDIVFVPNNSAKSALYRGSEAALQTATGVAIYRW